MSNDFEVDLNEQEEDNIDSISKQSLHNAVVTSTDWTTETIITQMQRGNIRLNPRFQRRDSWTIDRKSRFLESIFLGLPIPQIVLAEEKNQRGKFIVLDGKQRLTTLLQFSGHASGTNNSFKLHGLVFRNDLNKIDYSRLTQDPQLLDDLNSFHNQTIRTVVIRNWPSEDFLYLIFIRLNTGSVSLSPQELRQALIPGPFVEFVDESACDSKQLQQLLGNTEPDFRMRDTELLLRHIAFKTSLSDYNGSLKSFLDDTCRRINDNWEIMETSVRNNVEDFNRSIEFCFEVFGEDGTGRKWTGIKYQKQFNRAIFDVQAFFFSDPDIRSKANQYKSEICESYKSLCINSIEFQDSITSTTKSINATFNRFYLWAQSLNAILGDSIKTPHLSNNRIIL